MEPCKRTVRGIGDHMQADRGVCRSSLWPRETCIDVLWRLRLCTSVSSSCQSVCDECSSFAALMIAISYRFRVSRMLANPSNHQAAEV
jgi:hypothetical protein